MLSSYFISPKNIRTKKKTQKTNKPTNKQSIYHQTRHTYTKNEEKKTQAHPVWVDKLLTSKFNIFAFKKKSLVFSITRKQHVSNI